MCNNGFGGGSCCWIIILIIILFLFCGNDSCGVSNGSCGCSDRCGC